ncbi:MAG: phosphotransferase [Nitrospinae bacterium]|nr:phosphotransferase [Nitrospinota bacterium]
MSEGTLKKEDAARLIASAKQSGTVASITMLAGDASTRKYFRIALDGGDTYVVMMAPDEGQVTGFYSMTRLLRAMNVDTPEFFSQNGNLALLEDCGDELLQNRLARLDAQAVEREYRNVIDSLVDFQKNAAILPDKSHGCFKLAFDFEKLMWEIDFANTHFLAGHLGLAVSPDLSDAAKKEWGTIVDALAERMETLAHRDFHSRNILAIDHRRVWIDYQDARMGRRTYDLASLLLDPYADLAPELSDRLADYYFDKLSGTSGAEWEKERFDELYDLSGIQRIYKALGTYGFQASVRKTDVYLPYIAPALCTLERLLNRRLDFGAIRQITGMSAELVKGRPAPRQ